MRGILGRGRKTELDYRDPRASTSEPATLPKENLFDRFVTHPVTRIFYGVCCFGLAVAGWHVFPTRLINFVLIYIGCGVTSGAFADIRLRRIIFVITEPLVGQVRRETPAKYHYWLCVLKASAPFALLSAWRMSNLIRFETVETIYGVATGVVMTSCGVLVWHALDNLLFDAELRQHRKMMRQKLRPLPSFIYPPAGSAYGTRAGYRGQEWAKLAKAAASILAAALAFVFVAPLADRAPIFLGQDNHLFSQGLIGICAAGGVTAFADAFANLAFQGFELMRENGIREGKWQGEMPTPPLPRRAAS